MSSEDAPNVRLRLWSDERSLPVVGHVLSGLSACLGLDALAANDLGTAVAEACKNVVVHAYEGAQGPFEVEMRAAADLVEVVVRDDGIGIRPHLGERTRPHNGIGLPIVHLLTKQLVYTNLDGGGTELRMRFQMPGVQALPAAPPPGLAEQDFRELSPAQVSATLAPSALTRRALAPLLAAVAIRAGCGEAAAARLWPALEALAGSWAGEAVTVRAELADQGGLELRLGPLTAGAAAALLPPFRAGEGGEQGLALLSLPGA